MKSITNHKVATILENCIDRTFKRIEKNKTHRPFHKALLTKEIVNASSFERSFSTSFGQGPIEEISMLIAKDAGFEVKRQKETQINVFKGAIDEVERICSSLRGGDKTPNWEKEVKKITSYSKGDTEVRRIISDLWLKKEEIETFISIKTVKPNLDQTEKAKSDMLLLKAHDKKYQVYFALFYNPGGENRQDYNWKIPSSIFDMLKDSVVLIGQDYWNFLGENDTTYNDLLKIFEDVGKKTRKKISGL